MAVKLRPTVGIEVIINRIMVGQGGVVELPSMATFPSIQENYPHMAVQPGFTPGGQVQFS